MELSIAYELYMKPHEVDTDTAMGITAGAGFRYVDMSIGPFCLNAASPVLKPGWERWADKTADTARKHGLRMLQAHCLLFNYMDKNAADYAYLTNVNRHLLFVCKALGIEYLVFHPGTDYASPSAKRSLEGSAEWLLPFVELAEKLGIRLCLENVFDGISDRCLTRCYGARPEELLELVEKLNSGSVGICWDSGHAHMAKLDQEQSLRILGNRVWTTHLHDNRGQYDNDLHLPPFYGSLDWAGMMRGFRAIDYSGTLNFEIERHTLPLELMEAEFRMVWQKGSYLQQLAKGRE